VEKVIDNALAAGLFHESERSVVTETIQWIVCHPILKISFDDGWMVKTEASLLVPNENERRIDRFAKKGNHVILIDYKTGNPTTQDQVQVKEYLKLLERMQYEQPKGFLVYVNERECMEVK
jgi:CRISPR/Cas system-associated exonuclease Cas4 (RecB family)